MLVYRIDIVPDDDTYLVTCPALPEVATFGDTPEDAAFHATDAIETALAGRIADGADIPEPDGAGTSTSVRIPALTGLKVALHQALRASGMTRAELSRRLGWHREQVDRLFRLDHASRLEQFEAAFKALGRELDFEIRSAA